MPTENECAKLLRELRWGEKPIKCLFCDSNSTVSNGTYMINYRKFICKKCGKSFNEKTGTMFEDSKIPIKEWIYIARGVMKNKSINQISDELERAYQHVMHAVQKIKKNKKFMNQFMDLIDEGLESNELYNLTGERIINTIARNSNAAFESFKDFFNDNVDVVFYSITGKLFTN